MPDEFHIRRNLQVAYYLTQLLNFILYHLCNFPVFVSKLKLAYKIYIYQKQCFIKGVLDPNFRLFCFKLKKIRFFEINFDLGFKVL